VHLFHCLSNDTRRACSFRGARTLKDILSVGTASGAALSGTGTFGHSGDVVGVLKTVTNRLPGRVVDGTSGHLDGVGIICSTGSNSELLSLALIIIVVLVLDESLFGGGSHGLLSVLDVVRILRSDHVILLFGENGS